MSVIKIKLSEILANSGKLVKVFAKVLSHPDEDKYMIADESAIKLLIVDPTFENSKTFVIGQSLKIFKPRIENGRDVIIADSKTIIFETSQKINVVQECDEDTLNLPKEQVNITNYRQNFSST